MYSRICKHNYRITIIVKIGYHDHSPAGLVVTGVPLARDDMHSPRATVKHTPWINKNLNYFFATFRPFYKDATHMHACQKPHAVHGKGLQGNAPPRKFRKMVHFGVYFDQVFSSYIFKNYHLYITLMIFLHACYGVLSFPRKF